MTLTLQSFAASDKNYVAKMNANNAEIESAVNSLISQISAAVGDGSLLILDENDRDGIMGEASYQIDLATYAGGATIKIGRRPAPVLLLGDLDLSIAWATFAGVRHRVTQTGDVTLNAAAIVAGLPKTVYVGIPSSGTAQLFPDTVTANVLYIYSMTWDGSSLSNFQRIAPILMGYTTHEALANAVRILQIFDGESDFLDSTEGALDLPMPGSADDNGIGVAGGMEVVGFMITANRSGPDGVYAPTGAAPDNQLTLEIISEALKWNLDPIVFDCSNVPNTIFSRVDLGVVGLDRFVTEFRSFRLRASQVGSAVVSARGFTIGILTRPLIGTQIPKDSSKVDML